MEPAKRISPEAVSIAKRFLEWKPDRIPSPSPRELWEQFKKTLIRRCTEENKNLLVLIVGETGSGKSWAALRLGQELDPNFNADRICFLPNELLELVNLDLPPASVIVLDEAQLVADHRKWFTATVDVIRYLSQTVRFKNHILIFVTPDAKLIDSDVRSLFHLGITMTGYINRRIGRSQAKLADIEKASWLHTHGSREVYLPFPKIKFNKRSYTLKYVWFSKPKKSLIEEYERKKEEHLREFYAGLKEKLEKLKKELTLGEITQLVLADVDRFKRKGKVRDELISIAFNISKDKARTVKFAVEAELERRMEKKKEATSIRKQIKKLMEI